MATAPRQQPLPPGPADERRKGNFVAESWAELKKVEWPGQNQVIQGTVVVLVACVVVGSYLYLNDQVWKQVVSKLFLGQ
jgi:preprotein translocase subunit SecE